MLNFKQDILHELDLCREEIRRNLESKGINASGRTSESIQIRGEKNRFTLLIGGDNTAPAETLEIGRPPAPAPAGFVDIIAQWMKDKGISSGNDKIDRSIAGAIIWGKNGIVKTGTHRHKTKAEDVYSTATKNAAVSINDIIARSVRTTLHELLVTKGSGASTIKSNF